MNSEHQRICEAYLRMVHEARYRPAAPGDGLGAILLSPAQRRDQQRLEREAAAYATQFIREENTQRFHIGLSSFDTNRAFVLTVEAARLLCAGQSRLAQKLLLMAADEVEKARSPRYRVAKSWGHRGGGGIKGVKVV